ncbi:unnamed protein product [Echinostoma caproni]|uniref:PHB domain-containing protein n=1 Tax=Echinostoma caproni TaxID=27848 RepID=A0A183BG02_9TREM|nr:unnamed protein product [Echinostoma caproni]
MNGFLFIAGDIQLPQKIKEAMQMQVEADRKKRAAILESEGQRESAINRAEGMKRSQVLASEGERTEITNKALGKCILRENSIFPTQNRRLMVPNVTLFKCAIILFRYLPANKVAEHRISYTVTRMSALV